MFRLPLLSRRTIYQGPHNLAFQRVDECRSVEDYVLGLSDCSSKKMTEWMPRQHRKRLQQPIYYIHSLFCPNSQPIWLEIQNDASVLERLCNFSFYGGNIFDIHFCKREICCIKVQQSCPDAKLTTCCIPFANSKGRSCIATRKVSQKPAFILLSRLFKRE